MAADLIQETSSSKSIPFGYVLKTNPDGKEYFAVIVEAAAGSGPTPDPGVDREIATVTYRVKTAFTGASVGDTVTSIRVLNLSGPTPVQDSITWFNDSTSLPLAAAPAAANIEPLASGGITNAQMAALLSGMSTAALQTTGNAAITAMSAKLPASVGAKAGAASLSFVPATDARLTVGSKYKQAIVAVPDNTDVPFMVGEFGQLMVQAMGVINGIPYNPQLLQDGTNRSGTLAALTAQVLAPVNTARRQLTGQNISTGDLWFNEIGGNAVINGAGSYRVPAGSSFAVSTNRAISVIGATVGQAWTATEF